MIVNRNPYIKTNYERYVNGNRARHKKFPFISWMYLLKLNLKYGFSKIGHKHERKAVLREKQTGSTAGDNGISFVTEIADKLCRSDVVSFDLFDTLIFRPFSVPSDIFYCVGESLNYPDFKTIRTEAEKTLREVKGARLKIADIYDFIEDQTGIEAKLGCETEMAVEAELATPNPVMKKVWDIVKSRGKRIIVATDMYLPARFIKSLLEKNGFLGAEKIFVSSECGQGKHEGTMYEYIQQKMGTDSISHIGDNKISDVKKAKKHGIKAIEYRNVNLYGNMFRPKDMQQVTGSAYSGIINTRLYRGDMDYSPAYEYGYKYGGILLLGLCEHIHRLCRKAEADAVLFLSEGGYIVKKIYDEIYPEECCKYIYWSERAAVKLTAEEDYGNFIRYFVSEKVNNGLSVYDVMETIGIADWELPFALNEELTTKNQNEIEQYLIRNKGKIVAAYKGLREAAQSYMTAMLDKKRYLCVEFATLGNAGKLLEKFVSGCESVVFGDTDIYSKLIFGSPEPVFLEYRLSTERSDGYELVFEENVRNELYINEIQKGETEFVQELLRRFKDYEIIKNISLNNAQTPFEYALKHDKHYIDMVFADCVFDK